jgi:AraC-like DNA-binding protein
MSPPANRISDSDIVGARARLRWRAAAPDSIDNPYSLKVVDADLGPGFLMARRSSPVPLLLVAYAGSAWLRLSAEDRGSLLGPSEAVFVPAGQPVAYASHRGSRFGHFGIEWLRPQNAPHTEAQAGLRRAADPQPFRYAFEGLCHELINQRHGLVLHGWLQVIDQLARRIIQERDRPSPLAPLLHALERDLARSWSLAEMAQVAALSESSLRRLFHKELGEAPSECLSRLRLSHAAALLTGSTAKLADIAEQVGYATPFALSKAFTAHYGKSPRDYREQHAARS